MQDLANPHSLRTLTRGFLSVSEISGNAPTITQGPRKRLVLYSHTNLGAGWVKLGEAKTDRHHQELKNGVGHTDKTSTQMALHTN